MLDGDELAGIASQFGALTRDELVRAVEELAFKRGETADAAAVADAVDGALADLHLVAVERDGEEVLAPGPTAFPRLPSGADDLPHILDAPERSVPREALVDPAEHRLRETAAAAVADDDSERIERLLDATYDLESWAPDADVASIRERLDAALAAGSDGGDAAAADGPDDGPDDGTGGD
ncbi:MAG: hypothetical protein ABEH78_05195 [Haloferacaceae archaeon]